MKRLMTIATLVLFAAPLVAAQKKAADPAAAAVNPLVAAAKRTNRSASKTPVITDASVKNATGGHVTTTTILAVPKVPIPRPSPEVAHNKQRASDKAAEATRAAEAREKDAAEETRKQRLAAAAEEYEGGYDDGDPSRVERDLSEATSGKPETTPKP